VLKVLSLSTWSPADMDEINGLALGPGSGAESRSQSPSRKRTFASHEGSPALDSAINSADGDVANNGESKRFRVDDDSQAGPSSRIPGTSLAAMLGEF